MIGNSLNKGLPKTLRPANPLIVIICLVFAVAASPSGAQNVRLTAEQQLMLDQLPASQRQQALQALEQLNRQQSGGTQQTSIAEELSPFPQGAQPQPEEDEEGAEEPQAGGGSRKTKL